MKYDYQVRDIYGNEETCDSFLGAVSAGKKLMELREDCDPIIDQYYKDDELTGKYWKYDYKKMKFVEPPTLKELVPAFNFTRGEMMNVYYPKKGKK